MAKELTEQQQINEDFFRRIFAMENPEPATPAVAEPTPTEVLKETAAASAAPPATRFDAPLDPRNPESVGEENIDIETFREFGKYEANRAIAIRQSLVNAMKAKTTLFDNDDPRTVGESGESGLDALTNSIPGIDALTAAVRYAQEVGAALQEGVTGEERKGRIAQSNEGKPEESQTQLRPQQPGGTEGGQGGLSPELDDPKLNALVARAQARYALSNVPGENTLPLIRLALEAKLGQPVLVRRGDHGEPEYLEPLSNRWTIFNEPGMDVEDLSGSIGALWPLVGEVLGAGAGIAAGVASGGAKSAVLTDTVIGTFVGATLGQFFRLAQARDDGLLQVKGEDPDWETLMFRAARTAGVPAGVAQLLVVPAVSAWQRLSSRSVRRLDTIGQGQLGPVGGSTTAERKVLMDELDQRVARAGQLQAQLGEAAGGKVPPLTVGQLSVGGSSALEELTVVEQKLSRQTGVVSRALGDTYKEQNEALELILRKTATDAGINPDEAAHDAFTIGKSLRDKFRMDRKKRFAARESAVERAKAKASGEIEQVTPESESLRLGDYDRLGASLKDDAISPEMGYANEAIAVQYRELNRMWREPLMGMDAQHIPLVHFESQAKGMLDEVGRALLPTMSEPEQKLLQAVFQRAKVEPVSHLGGVPITIGAFESQTATIEQVNGALSVLSRQLRKVDANVTGNVDTATLERIIGSLKKDRALAASKNPVLLAKIDAVDAFVYQTKNALDRSLLGDLVTRSGGRDAVINTKVFNKVWNSEEVGPVEDLALLLNGRSFKPGALSPEEHSLRQVGWMGMRRAIKSDYRSKVVDDATRLINPKAHRDYLLKHDDQMKNFFNPEEMEEIRKLGGVGKVVDQAEARYAKFMELYKDTFAGKMGAAKDPMDVFEKVWNFKRTAGTEGELRQLLRWSNRFDPDGSLGLVKGLREVAHEDLMRTLTVKGTGNNVLAETPSRFNFKNLEGFLGQHENQMRVLFGDEYVQNVRTVSHMLTQMSAKPALKRSLETNASPIRHIIRGILGIFTTPGRLLTAGIVIRGKSADQALAKLLLDPPLFAKVMRKRALPSPSPETTAILAGLGGLVLTEPDSWNDLLMPIRPAELGRLQGERARQAETDPTTQTQGAP